MRRSLSCLVAGVFILGAATPLTAAIYEQSWEFGAYGGIQSGDSDVSVSSDSAFGFKAAFAINPKIMIEANVDRFDTNRDIEGAIGNPSIPTQQLEFSHEGGTRFLSITLGLTANFFTETDSRTIPYLSVGIGAVRETRDETQHCIDLNELPVNFVTCADINPNGTVKDPNSNISRPRSEVHWSRSIEQGDTGTLLTMSAGARTFLSEWFGVRYEVRYFHHDAFDINQDAFEASAGVTFVVGGRR
jgi:hypothetical protein